MKFVMNIKSYRFFKNGLNVIGLLLLVISSTLVVLAQNSNGQEPAVTVKMSFYELLKIPGKLLSKGTNSVPVGELKVKTYRLEEISLTGVMDEKAQANMERNNRAFRLTIIGESFQSGRFIIWIGDAPLTDIIYGQKEITTIIYDPSVLEDGASISVTKHGITVKLEPGVNVSLPKHEEKNWDDTPSTIPDLLQVPVELQARQANIPSKYFIKEIRSVPKAPWLRGKDGVEIEIYSEEPFPARNEVLFLKIGDLELHGGGYKDQYTQFFRLSAEQFAQLKDNETVRLKYGLAPSPGIKIGRLNKNMLRAPF